MIRDTELPTVDVALFCVLAGVAGTFASGYTYGELNQVEHLPMILRMMDDGYLANDFFVNSVEGFNPRFYYAWLMAAAGTWVPLPLVFMVLTCMAVVAIAGVTWCMAKSISDRSDLAAVLACSMVIAVNGFSVGGSAQIMGSSLEPSLLARPLAMLGLWLTIRGRTVSPLLLFVAAIALHPLVGAETAAVALAAAGLVMLASHGESPGTASQSTGRATARLVGMVAAIIAAMLILWRTDQVYTLGTERFIHVLAEVRAPHHYLPSRFGAASHLAFAVFCLAALLSWMRWRHERPEAREAWAVLAVGGVVLIACLGGYVFVEVVPTRLWTSAQPFRMTYLIKWFGFLLFAHVATQSIRSDAPMAERLSGALLVLGVGRFQPAIAFMGNIGGVVSRFIGPARRASATALVVFAISVATALVVIPVSGRPAEPFALALMLVIGGCFLFLESPVWRRLLPTLFVGAGVMVLVGFRASPAVLQAARSVGVGAPRMSLPESARAWTEAAWFARANTPLDAVFVVPPRQALGGFRLTAGRAVVVDYKAFPFGDAEMEEWYSRLLFTHAGRLEGDLPTPIELQRSYLAIGDDRLVAVQQRYGATHALLWLHTSTRMRVLYEDQVFKIVRIEAP